MTRFEAPAQDSTAVTAELCQDSDGRPVIELGIETAAGAEYASLEPAAARELLAQLAVLIARAEMD